MCCLCRGLLCAPGQYAPYSNSTSCTTCAAGSIPYPSSAATVCVQCSACYYSLAGQCQCLRLCCLVAGCAGPVTPTTSTFTAPRREVPTQGDSDVVLTPASRIARPLAVGACSGGDDFFVCGCERAFGLRRCCISSPRPGNASCTQCAASCTSVSGASSCYLQCPAGQISTVCAAGTCATCTCTGAVAGLRCRAPAPQQCPLLLNPRLAQPHCATSCCTLFV